MSCQSLCQHRPCPTPCACAKGELRTEDGGELVENEVVLDMYGMPVCQPEPSYVKVARHALAEAELREARVVLFDLEAVDPLEALRKAGL